MGEPLWWWMRRVIPQPVSIEHRCRLGNGNSISGLPSWTWACQSIVCWDNDNHKWPHCPSSVELTHCTGVSATNILERPLQRVLESPLWVVLGTTRPWFQSVRSSHSAVEPYPLGTSKIPPGAGP